MHVSSDALGSEPCCVFLRRTYYRCQYLRILSALVGATLSSLVFKQLLGRMFMQHLRDFCRRSGRLPPTFLVLTLHNGQNMVKPIMMNVSNSISSSADSCRRPRWAITVITSILDFLSFFRNHASTLCRLFGPLQLAVSLRRPLFVSVIRIMEDPADISYRQRIARGYDGVEPG